MAIKRIEPGPGQESVWDYPRPPRQEDCAKTIKVVVDGVVIAESNQTNRVLETSHPPVYYIPPADIRMELLESTDRQSWCEWKGKARYYDVGGGERRIANAAWSYPSPTRAFELIRDYLAFYPHLMDACFVGEERVKNLSENLTSWRRLPACERFSDRSLTCIGEIDRMQFVNRRAFVRIHLRWMR